MSDVSDHDLQERQEAAARRLAPLIKLSVPASAGAAVGAIGGAIAALTLPMSIPVAAATTLVLTALGSVGAVANSGYFSGHRKADPTP